MARTNRDDIYASPVAIVELFNNTRKEIGDKILSSAKYKVLREGWIVSMYAVSLSMMENTVWWLRSNPDDVTPDYYAFKAIPWDKKLGYNEGINREWEVFEWGKWSKTSLLDTIVKKVTKTNAPKITAICYASKENELLDFGHIRNELKKTKVGVLEVYILSKIKELDMYCSVRVYPDPPFVMPVPTSVPERFSKPFSFVSKYRGKGREPDDGLWSINDQMEFKRLPEVK